MRLQTDPDQPPHGISFQDTLRIAYQVVGVFEQMGMTEKSSKDAKITKDTVRVLSNLLKCKKKVTRLYLLNVLETDPRSRGSLLRTAIRMVAIRDLLRVDHCPPATPYFSQPHWAGAMIVNIGTFFDAEKKRVKLGVDFLVISGELAGTIVNSTFSKGFGYVAREEIGAKLKGKEAQIDNASELLNLVFCYACIYVGMRKTTYVERVSATSSMKSYNKRLVRSRLRVLSDCPFNAMFDCVQCNATNKECPRAVRMS